MAMTKRRTPQEKQYIALRHAELKKKYPQMHDREIAERLGVLVGTLRIILQQYRKSIAVSDTQTDQS